MKNTFILLLLVYLISSFISKKSLTDNNFKLSNLDKKAILTNDDSCINVINKSKWDTIRLGDINNDKIEDSAFIYTPETVDCFNYKNELQFTLGCLNDCFNRIKFSCKLPEIVFNNSVWGCLQSIDDINKDGYKELIFSPGWFISCWGHLYIYSYDGIKWTTLSNVTYWRCVSEDIPLESYVKKIKNKYYLEGVRQELGENIKYKVQIKFKTNTKKEIK